METAPRLIAIINSQQSRHFLNDGFSETGYSVETIDNAEFAMGRVREHGADLILLDVADDTDHGVAALQALRREWSADELPVIALTSSTHCHHVVQLLEAGANDFVLTPLTITTLGERIRLALAGKEKVGQMLESERQRVMSETLAGASATTAAAVEGMVDQLEHLMQSPAGRDQRVEPRLHHLLDQTEHAVAAIDCIRRIAMLTEVSYATRKHLLDNLKQLQV